MDQKLCGSLWIRQHWLRSSGLGCSCWKCASSCVPSAVSLLGPPKWSNDYRKCQVHFNLLFKLHHIDTSSSWLTVALKVYSMGLCLRDWTATLRCQDGCFGGLRARFTTTIWTKWPMNSPSRRCMKFGDDPRRNGWFRNPSESCESIWVLHSVYIYIVIYIYICIVI